MGQTILGHNFSKFGNGQLLGNACWQEDQARDTFGLSHWEWDSITTLDIIEHELFEFVWVTQCRFVVATGDCFVQVLEAFLLCKGVHIRASPIQES